jgi:hypothetical protein
MIDLTPGDLVRIHASFVKADELVDRRRAVYRAAVAISSSQNGADLGWEKLDNPAVRAHLGEVLAGVASYDPGKVRSLDTLIDPDHSHSVGGSMVRVASAAVARSALVGALRRIDDQMHRHEANSALTLLTAGDSSFAAAARQVVDGSRLLTSLAPELAADLLAHVAVFAIVARSSAVRLGSASVKEYPGLVLVPEPDSPLAIAEAIVHEGAHQKFFRPVYNQVHLRVRRRSSEVPTSVGCRGSAEVAACSDVCGIPRVLLSGCLCDNARILRLRPRAEFLLAAAGSR